MGAGTRKNPPVRQYALIGPLGMNDPKGRCVLLSLEPTAQCRLFGKTLPNRPGEMQDLDPLRHAQLLRWRSSLER